MYSLPAAVELSLLAAATLEGGGGGRVPVAFGSGGRGGAGCGGSSCPLKIFAEITSFSLYKQIDVSGLSVKDK